MKDEYNYQNKQTYIKLYKFNRKKHKNSLSKRARKVPLWRSNEDIIAEKFTEPEFMPPHLDDWRMPAELEPNKSIPSSS